MIRFLGATLSRRAIALIGICFTLIVLLSLVYNFRKLRQHTLEMALIEARTLYDLNLAYRLWWSHYGGLYVVVTDSVEPNPYLEKYPGRDIVTREGVRLTLMSPETMTRQAHAVLAAHATRSILSKVTSLKLVNPANSPDEWETGALRSVEKGKNEVSELTTISAQPYMRLLKPLLTEKSCLPCHASQGYKAGDVRGGLSIAIPMDPYLERMSIERRGILISHLLIWLIGLGGMGALGMLVRRAEQSYAGEREFTETAINTMQGAFCVLDERGRYVRWNDAVAGIWGEDAANLRGRESSDIVHPDDRPRYVAAMGEAFRSGHAATEARLAPPGRGEPKHYYLTARGMVIEGRTYLVVSGSDITARKSFEERLRTAAIEWAATFDAIRDGIVILDRENRILRCNAAMAQMCGLPMDRILGKPLSDVMHDGRIPAAWPVARPTDGETSHSAVIEFGGRTCLVEADPILDASGEVAGVVHTISDVTQQRKLEMQLFQAQKMEAIGTLAGGIAHDFNNILSAIVGWASLMELKTTPEDPRRRYAESILLSTERATNLTKSLLSFARKQVTELKPVSLGELVLGFQKMLARLIREDISFTVTCCPGNLVVDADRGQIEQVLMNLVTNARDAMPRGGRLTLSTDRAEFAQDAGEVTRGTYAVISVSDTGIGMDKETQEHLFEPFFTTKAAENGTGLGLSVTYGIVKAHKGVIHVYSEKGIGTTFKIFIPVSQVPAEGGASPDAPVPLPAGSGTILLVEDDLHTREMVRILLEEFGYTVLAASDGEEALRVFREHGERIQLVLTDLIMPGKNGREAFEEMNGIRPGIEAIFMSGYSTEIIEERGLLERGMHLLAKPLNPKELVETIRRVLGT